jgi:hypothetical protein
MNNSDKILFNSNNQKPQQQQQQIKSDELPRKAVEVVSVHFILIYYF